MELAIEVRICLGNKRMSQFESKRVLDGDTDLPSPLRARSRAAGVVQHVDVDFDTRGKGSRAGYPNAAGG